MSIDDENNKISYHEMLNELNDIYNNKFEYHTQLYKLHLKNIDYITKEKELHKKLILNIFQKIDPCFEKKLIISSNDKNQKLNNQTENSIANYFILDKNTQSKTENPIYDENYDFGLESQDLVWERIRKARLNQNLEETGQNLEETGQYPVLNALFKVNPLKRKEIIKEIFNKSKDNITELAKLDSKYNDNYDIEVEKEADRLLNVYLKSH